jgi:RNA polymerase sigma-70 factor (ECF subfamily)
MAEPTPDSPETQDLLGRARAGDRGAFEQLFARHRAYLRQVVDLRLPPQLRARIDASDIVQEAQLEAFRRLDDFLERRPMSFRLWLRKTACERLLKARRHYLEAARRDVEREIRLDGPSSLFLAERLLGREPTPSQDLARHERIRRVQQALARLADADLEIVLMRNLEALSYQEIATVLEIEPAAARKRYGRALLRLQRLLSEDGQPDNSI